MSTERAIHLFEASMMLALAACSNPSVATDCLVRHGFTDIVIVGYALLRCPDSYESTAFVATSPTGRRASGAVCSSEIEVFIVEDDTP